MNPFETLITESPESITGPWRRPHQMLHAQVYDLHASIYDDATAQKLGFQGGTIEGPTHFSQFAPLCVKLWGNAWFETGCISAHYRNPSFEGEEVQALVAKPQPGERQVAIQMVKRDGTEVLRGTASVGDHKTPTALEHRLGELKPLADPVILRDVKVGMKTGRQTVRMDFEQNMGDLYPFSLAEKLKVITEPSPFYAGAENPWGRQVIPIEMLSVLFQYRAQRGPPADQGPGRRAVRRSGNPAAARAAVRRRGVSNRARSGGLERQPPDRKPVGADHGVWVGWCGGRDHAAQPRQHQGFLRDLQPGIRRALRVTSTAARIFLLLTMGTGAASHGTR